MGVHGADVVEHGLEHSSLVREICWGREAGCIPIYIGGAEGLAVTAVVVAGERLGLHCEGVCRTRAGPDADVGFSWTGTTGLAIAWDGARAGSLEIAASSRGLVEGGGPAHAAEELMEGGEEIWREG